MAKKKKFNLGIIVVLVLFSLSAMIFYLYGGSFSLFESGHTAFYQSNVGASNTATARFGTLEIVQNKAYYGESYSDYYCGANTCGQPSIGFDEYGCEIFKGEEVCYADIGYEYYNSRTRDYYYTITPYTNAYCSYTPRLDTTTGKVYVEAWGGRNNCGQKTTQPCGYVSKICTSYTCQNPANMVYDLKPTTPSCGGLKRDKTSTAFLTGCFHSFSVKNNGQTLFTSDVMDSKTTYLIPSNPRGELVEKELYSYDNSNGYVNCPYFKGETIADCEVQYGNYNNMRNLLVPKNELTEITTSDRPVPYFSGLWGESRLKRYSTAEGRGEGYIYVNFKEKSDIEYSRCQSIDNTYSYNIESNAFSINISSPKQTYIEGEDGSVEVLVVNDFSSEAIMRLNVLYAIPTAFGDKEKFEQKIVNLDLGENKFTFSIPTEQVIDQVKVSVSGELVVPGSYFGGLLDACLPGSNTLVPTTNCDYVSIGSLAEESNIVTIKKIEVVPEFCADLGITTITECDEYIKTNVNDLNMDINGKIDLINTLQATRDEKIDIILQLEANINEQATIIDAFELSISEQKNYIEALGLTLDEQDELISKLELTVSEKQQLILQLENKLDEQARDILALDLSVQQQAEYIKDLNLNIEEQAILINKLTSNLQIKADLVSQLTAENEIQADLIRQMEVSFANQGAIVEKLDLTVQEDALIIAQLTDNNEEQGRIIEGMNLEIDEQRRIIASLTTSNQEMGEIISQLKLKTEEQRFLVESFSKSINEQVEIISNMKLTNQQQKDLIKQLTNKISEQEDMLKQLSDIIEKERSAFANTQIYLYIAIGGIIMLISAIFLAKRGKKK